MKSGMTVLELVIVIAVMAILAAILVPNLATISDRSKLKSDIQSVQLIQNAVSVYNAEHTGQLALDTDTIEDDMEKLVLAGYIKDFRLQTDKISLSKNADGLVLDLTLCSDSVKAIVTSLSDKEQSYVISN